MDDIEIKPLSEEEARRLARVYLHGLYSRHRAIIIEDTKIMPLGIEVRVENPQRWILFVDLKRNIFVDREGVKIF